MRKSVLSFLVLAAMSSFATSVTAQESPVSYLLRANGFTPVPDHQSDLVPGMILTVNYQEGSWEFKDPEQDASALALMPPLTRSLDKMTSTKITGIAAATAGLKALIGFDPSVSFSSDNVFTFSGVKFKGVRLKSGDVTKLVAGGATHDAAMALIQSGRNDVFLVTEVDSTMSMSVTSDKEFTVSGGTSSGQSDLCTTRPAANSGTTPPATDGSASPDNTTTSSTAAKNGKKGDTSKQTKGSTVADAKKQTASIDDTAKASASSGSEMGGSVTVCKKSTTSYVFLNDVEVPSALKVTRLVVLRNGLLAQYNGAAAVPLGDSRLLHRVRQGNDPYDPPHPRN